MEPIITESLQKTVRLNPTLDKVYFDEAGRHYFNVHKLRATKEDTNESNWSEYGSGLISHRQIIPGSEHWATRGDSGVTEVISKGNPETKIVATLTRSEIINAKAKPEGKSLIAQIANLTKEERKAAIELLKSEDEEDFNLSE